jgi:hypothetical protein
MPAARNRIAFTASYADSPLNELDAPFQNANESLRAARVRFIRANPDLITATIQTPPEARPTH